MLSYTVTFRLPQSGDLGALIDPDVRIEGNNFTIAWISPEQPYEGQPLRVDLELLEVGSEVLYTLFLHVLWPCRLISSMRSPALLSLVSSS
jgi:hypothetical protein